MIIQIESNNYKLWDNLERLLTKTGSSSNDHGLDHLCNC
jgi:hypothetical protein